MKQKAPSLFTGQHPDKEKNCVAREQQKKGQEEGRGKDEIRTPGNCVPRLSSRLEKQAGKRIGEVEG